MSDEELLPLDPTCPNCKERVDVGDVIDGSEVRCRACGATLNATAFLPSPGFPIGSFALVLASVPMAQRPRDRNATRARWRRTGRR